GGWSGRSAATRSAWPCSGDHLPRIQIDEVASWSREESSLREGRLQPIRRKPRPGRMQSLLDCRPSSRLEFRYNSLGGQTCPRPPSVSANRPMKPCEPYLPP